MEMRGCSEQLDPFCGSLIIEQLLMAWMFQQQGRLLVAIRLSPAVLTHVAASMHTRVPKRVSVCTPGLFIFVFIALWIYVFVHEYDLVCFCLWMYVWNVCARSCMDVFLYICLCVYVHINALPCCPGYCLLHNEGQTAEKGWLAFWRILPQTPSTLVCPLVSSSFPSLLCRFSRLRSCCKHRQAGLQKNIAVWHHHGNGHGFWHP